MTASTARRLTRTEIADLDPSAFMAVIGKRVIHPGGRQSTVPFLGYLTVVGVKPA